MPNVVSHIHLVINWSGVHESVRHSMPDQKSSCLNPYLWLIQSNFQRVKEGAKPRSHALLSIAVLAPLIRLSLKNTYSGVIAQSPTQNIVPLFSVRLTPRKASYSTSALVWLQPLRLTFRVDMGKT